MQYSNTLSVRGPNLAWFFQIALCTLMLAAFSGTAFAEKINLNTANAEALQYIPGIGASKAAAIIRIRKETGGFRTMEDLLAVPGVGKKLLVQLKANGSLHQGVSTLTKEMQANPPRRATKHKSAKSAKSARKQRH